MSGIPEATVIILTAEERAELESLARSTKTEHRLRQRARIVLLAADGVASRSIGRAVGCTTGTASKWRVRYARKRRAGLDETGERGAEPKYTTETNKRILALLDQPPPEGYARWTGPLLAAALGDVDVQYVWRLLRAQKIDLAGRKSWCESNDPAFVAKAADVVGLYMAPPENAIVICVDEKPSIQALERAQGYPGSIRSKSGSRSSRLNRSTEPRSKAFQNSSPISRLSSPTTTKPPSPSSGQKERSTKSASNPVSSNNDSGY